VCLTKVKYTYKPKSSLGGHCLSDQPGKKSKRKIIYVLFIVAAILAVGVISYLSFRNDNSYTMHGIKEMKITTIHSSSGNHTYTFVYENSNWRATYELGKKLTIHEPLYTNTTDPGITKLSSVICNTPGFSLSESSPVLPTDVPYAFDVAASTETVNLVFQTPTTPYTGVFEYTMYYDFTLG
jgi:hypothetical protein